MQAQPESSMYKAMLLDPQKLNTFRECHLFTSAFLEKEEEWNAIGSTFKWVAE